MVLPDVNVLVYAQREDLSAHVSAKSWLEWALNGGEGDDIPDAYLAALAIENDCEFISTDSDFSRFPGLKWRRPF
jgi:predicted nucleic acid-binding protein